jgi:hypothetical protein
MSNEPTFLARDQLRGSGRCLWDAAWDICWTATKALSQCLINTRTAKAAPNQWNNLTVPLSHAIETWTVGHPANRGTARGTAAGQWR